MGAVRRAVLAMLVAFLVAVGLMAVPTTASAAAGDIGYLDQSFTGVANPPTADKPQSKLWYNDGLWWAAMFDVVSQDWHIFRLDRSNAGSAWVDTGVLIDTRTTVSADTLWDGSKLYVATHVVKGGSAASVTARPARLYRYSYSASTKTYSLDTGFPKQINDVSSESLTIDKDTTGTIWATWTQVSGNSTAGFTSEVYLNSIAAGASAWGTPFVVPTTGGVNPAPAPDDISAIVAFGANKVGVLWSNQLDDSVYWSVHVDGAARTDWRGSAAIRGNREADDHLNIKAIQADTAGRVFAAVKTSLGDSSSAPSTDPQIRVLVFKPGTGSWSSTTFGTIADCHTRPQLMLDETNQQVHVVASGPTAGGTCTSTGAGTIYMKSAPMSDPVFPAGVGTPIIRDAASDNVNNASTTKQSVTAASGLVVLASNVATERYWHADISLGAPSDTTPPTVSGVSPAEGATGVAVSANVTGTFSEAMDPATISGSTFTLTDGAGAAVAAVVSYDAASRTATLNPSADLANSVTYTARITTGVKDANGNALAADKVWSFTTAAAG